MVNNAYITVLKELIDQIDKPLPALIFPDLEKYLANIIQSGKQVLAANIAPEAGSFDSQLFIAELKSFTQKLLTGIRLIIADTDRRSVLSSHKKALQTAVELYEARSQTSKADILNKNHLRIKIDFTKVLTSLRDSVR